MQQLEPTLCHTFKTQSLARTDLIIGFGPKVRIGLIVVTRNLKSSYC